MTTALILAAFVIPVGLLPLWVTLGAAIGRSLSFLTACLIIHGD